MSRDPTTGVYTAPASAVNPAVTRTKISSSAFNALRDDIEDALNGVVLYGQGQTLTDDQKEQFWDNIELREFHIWSAGTPEDITARLNEIAASSESDIVINLSAGDFILTDEALFTDKGLTIRGAGQGVTRIKYQNATAKISFLDTSIVSTVFNKLNVSGITFLQETTVTSGNGPTAIEARWSYAGIVASWEHASFSDITFQGAPTTFWNRGIHIIDAGCIRGTNIRFDNGGGQAADARCFFEIERDVATAVTGFQFTNCFVFGATAGIWLTHASAPAGTIEGIYIVNQETVGVRHVIYDDNESTGDTTRVVNGVSYTGGHWSVSFSAFCFGWVSGLFISANNCTFNNLADAGAALEAGIIARTSGQNFYITGSRFIKGSGAAANKPFLLLPTDTATRYVIMAGGSVEGFGSVVDQVGTPSTLPGRIYIDPNVQLSISVVTSTTGSGYRPLTPTVQGTITRAVAITEATPAPILAVRTTGYSAPGDGGGALYKRAASEPTHAGKFQDAGGAWFEIADLTLNVKSFGAVGDGVADDRSAIQAAIDVAYAAGGGVVRIPVGVFLVTEDGSTTVAIQMKDGVRLLGDNPYLSIIKLADSQNDCHVINMNGTTNCSISGVGVNGNRANNTGSGHGIRGNGLTNVKISGCYVFDTLHYGIGIQGGTNKNIDIAFNHVKNTGADGIDVKNLEDNNLDVWVRGNLVEGHSQDGGAGQAAIDLRGPITCVDNIARDFSGASSTSGIRLREGENGDPSGAGAHTSILSNNRVEPGASASGATCFTINVRDASVQGNQAVGGTIGFLIAQSRGTFVGNHAGGASTHGFLLDASGLTTEGDQTLVLGNMAVGNGGDGFRIEGDNNRLIGNGSISNTGWGVRLISGSASNRIVEHYYSGNTAGDLSDAGSSNAIVGARPSIQILAQSAVAASITGSILETALATVTIPANAMGANGAVRITTVWSYTNSANNKTLRVRFGGMSGTIHQTHTQTTTAALNAIVAIANRGATNSQVGRNSGVVASYGQGTGANTTGAVDTTSTVDIKITAELANSGETATLEYYLVELIVL